MKLLVITGTESSGKFVGQPFISFQYYITTGPFANKWVEYDRLDFNNVRSGQQIAGNPHFFVSGNPARDPTGTLLNDAEVDIEGFADAAEVKFTTLDASMWLLYLSGGSFQFVPHAFSSGADTGEQASNAYIKPTGMRGTGSVGSDNSIQLY